MSTPQMTFGQGWQPYLLKSVEQIVQRDQVPYLKIDDYGFLNMLQSQQKPREVVTLNRPGSEGQVNTVQFKYLQRALRQAVMNTDNCTQTNQTLWREGSITTSMFSAYALYIPDERMAHYQNDAVNVVMKGQPAAPLTFEFIEELSAAANAIYADMNANLSTKAYANIGYNRLTGNANSVSINISKDTTDLPLDDGITKILQQYRENSGYGKPWVVGSGYAHAYFLQQIAKSTAQNGLNTRIEAAQMDFYYDSEASALLGTNQVVVGQPNVMQLIESFQFKGFRAGYKGTSYFFTMMLPVQVTPNRVEMVEFDAQLKYYDCPGNTFTDYYYGTPVTVNRGWNIVLSKAYDLFYLPQDSYSAADPLYRNNGTLRYTFTNT